VRIRRLRVRNFRGIEECEVLFDTEGITVVEGPNEVGKSSLIEAIELLFWFRSDANNARVRAVRPLHKEADPEVEADLSTGPYELTYKKRFAQGRRGETTLTIRGPRSESIAGREAHERMEQILNKTLDRTLWDVLRFEQGSAVSLPSQLDRSRSLQEALDAAAGGTAAGDREESLFKRVEEEFGNYFTASGRLRRDLDDLFREVSDLEAEEQRLQQELAALESLTDQVERLAKEVAQKEAGLGEAQANAARSRAALEQVEEKALEIERLEREVEAVKSEVSRLEEKAERRREQIKEEKRLEEEESRLASRIDELGGQRQMAQEVLHRAIERYNDARSQQQEYEALRRIRAKDLDFRKAEFDLQLLKERLARVEEAEAEIADAEAVLRKNAVDDASLERLQDLDSEVRNKRRDLAVASPSITLEAHTDCTLTIAGRPKDFQAGQAFEDKVTSDTTIEIPGYLSMTIRPAVSAYEAARGLQEAEARLRQLLSELGVADVSEARRRNEDRRDALRKIEEAKKRKNTDLRDLTPEELRERTRGLEAFVGSYLKERPQNPPIAADVTESRRLLEEAEKDLEKAREDFASAEVARDQAQKECQQLDYELGQLQLQHSELRGRLDTIRAELKTERQRMPDDELDKELQSKAAELAEKDARLEAAKAEYEALEPDAVRARAENDEAVLERLRQELQRSRDEFRDKKALLEARGAEGIAGRLGDVRAKLEHKRREWESQWRRAQAAKKLYETMKACRNEAFRRYRAPLKQKIEELGRIVFGSDFSVDIDENLAITSRTLGGVTVPFDRLSVGTREQLSILVRLATSSLVDPQAGVPVILDDALGYSDPQRLEALGATIRSVAKQRSCQIILLTCYPDRYRFIGDATVVKLPQSV
jgi:chromosome segregation ATPase